MRVHRLPYAVRHDPGAPARLPTPLCTSPPCSLCTCRSELLSALRARAEGVCADPGARCTGERYARFAGPRPRHARGCAPHARRVLRLLPFPHQRAAQISAHAALNMHGHDGGLCRIPTCSLRLASARHLSRMTTVPFFATTQTRQRSLFCQRQQIAAARRDA